MVKLNNDGCDVFPNDNKVAAIPDDMTAITNILIKFVLK